MSPTGSVTTWLAQLKAGEQAALHRLHQRYWPLLVNLARKRLHGITCTAADEEDVAQEAFVGFCHSFQAGRVPWLVSRSDLLALLTQIVARKALNQIKHEVGVQKRGHGRVRHASTLSADPLESLEQLEDDRPTPFDQALLNDCYEHYLNALPPELQDYATLYLAGQTYREIAARLNCSQPTVGRKIALILVTWQEMAAESFQE